MMLYIRLKLFGICLTLAVFLICCYKIQSSGVSIIVALLISSLISLVFLFGYYWICIAEEHRQLIIDRKDQEAEIMGGLYRLISEATKGRGMVERERVGLYYQIRVFYLKATKIEQESLLEQVTRYIKRYDDKHIIFKVAIASIENSTDRDEIRQKMM